MKKIRQIISILSVMAVMVSATVGISRVSAATLEYKLDTKTVDAGWLTKNSENNLLTGCYLREYRGDSMYDTNNSTVKDRLFRINDNEIDTYSELSTSADPVMYSFNPKSTLNVKQVVLSFAETSEIKDFDVYFADVEDKATLFANDNQNKLSVTAVAGERNYLITLNSAVNCKYIGVSVKKGDTAGNYNLHIAEIAAYGESSASDDFDQSFLDANVSKNIAKDMSVQEMRNGNGTGTFTQMTDNDLSTLRGAQPSSAATIDYDFSFAYGRPVKQLILAYADDSAILDFDVYLSNINAFTNATSETYVKNIVRVETENNKKNYLITLNEPVMASRVVFRLKNPDSASISYNIAELGIYADDVNYTSAAVAKNDYYFNNSYYNILDKATVTVDDKNPGYLTDGKFDTPCELTGEDGNYTLTAEYELPEVLTVNKFMVASVWGGIPQGVEIYASETKEDLYNTAPITYTHNRTSASSFNDASNALEITLNSPVKAKYIGFKFTDAEATLYVSEIGAYSYADTNRDGALNVCDLVYINEKLNITDVYADYNKDNTVDVKDINALRSELLNK